MSKFRVVAQEEAGEGVIEDPRYEKATPVSPEEEADLARKEQVMEQELLDLQKTLDVEDIPEQADYTQLEVLVTESTDKEVFISDTAGTLYSVFVAPDNNSIIVQPITMILQRQKPLRFNKDEKGDLPWRTVTEEIFPGGFTRTDIGVTQGVQEATASLWQKVVAKMLKGYSYKKHYIAKVANNPYIK